MALTDKQTRFVEEYCLDFNATQAAIRAGYAKNSAKQQGSRLLTNDDIRHEVARRGQQTADELGLTRGYVLTRLQEVIERSLEGAPKTTTKGDLVFGPAGDHIIEWSPSGAKAGLELLAKLRGDLVDTVEHTGGIDIRVEGVPVDDLK